MLSNHMMIDTYRPKIVFTITSPYPMVSPVIKEKYRASPNGNFST
jgi:hypothetical protein